MSTIADYLDFGRIGVVAFFCISGFVIPNSLRGDRLPAIRRFAINRFFRLYPIYWISILPGILFMWTAWGKTIDWSTLASNATMLPSFFGAEPVMGLYWTLEVEFVFYLSCATLYLIFGNIKLPVILIAFTTAYTLYHYNPLLTSHGHLPVLFYHLTIMFAASALRGLFEYFNQQSTTSSKPVATIYSALVLIAGILTTLPAISAIENSYTDLNTYWNKFGYAYLIGIGIFVMFLVNRKTPKPLSRIGRYTYSVYLFHAVVFYAILKIILETKIEKGPMYVYTLLTTIITISIAASTYKTIEAPSVKLGKYINTILDRKSTR